MTSTLSTALEHELAAGGDRRRSRVPNRGDQVGAGSGPAVGHDGDVDQRGDQLDQLEVEALTRALAIDRGDQDLPDPDRTRALCPLLDGQLGAAGAAPAEDPQGVAVPTDVEGADDRLRTQRGDDATDLGRVLE